MGKKGMGKNDDIPGWGGAARNQVAGLRVTGVEPQFPAQVFPPRDSGERSIRDPGSVLRAAEQVERLLRVPFLPGQVGERGRCRIEAQQGHK